METLDFNNSKKIFLKSEKKENWKRLPKAKRKRLKRNKKKVIKWKAVDKDDDQSCDQNEECSDENEGIILYNNLENKEEIDVEKLNNSNNDAVDIKDQNHIESIIKNEGKI